MPIKPGMARSPARRDPRQAASTRFLVEISPSRLGPVQLDGLLRGQRDGLTRLDMVVRSATDLDEDQTREVDRLFKAALSAVGLKGTLVMQPGRHGFVLPQSDEPHRFTRMV